MDIDIDQIQRQGRWAGDSMHKGYLTSLPRRFMRGMAGFQPEHGGAYFIARAQVEPPSELVLLIFSKLNHWLQQPTDDIATKQFLKLLNYLRVVFLQDSVILRNRYPTHSLWHHKVFKHPLYLTFAANVIARLDDKDRDMNSQIQLAIPLLGQQVLNLDASLSSLIAGGFNQQREQAEKLEGKLDDFLDGKITFELTPIKRQKVLGMMANSRDTPISIDPRLQASSSTNSISFVSPTRRTASSSHAERQRPSSPCPQAPSYFLNRQVHTVPDLFREWTIGLGTDPSVASLNDQYGCSWRKEWVGKDKEFYSKRYAIIKSIYAQAQGGSLKATVTRMEAERLSKKTTLNGLATQLRKASK